jgi:hypothetical protein
MKENQSHKMMIYLLLFMIGVIAAGCSESPTRADDDDSGEATLYLSLRLVSMVPGAEEEITVYSKDKNDLRESFTVSSNSGNATVFSTTDSTFIVTGVSYGEATVTVTINSGKTQNLPVKVYDPTIMDTGDLIITFTSQFEEIVYATDPFWIELLHSQFYKPIVPEGFQPLGSFIHWTNLDGHPDNQKGVMVVKAAEGSDALAHPDSFQLIWGFQGSYEVYFWRPVPPDGYKALGDMVTGIGNPQPPPVESMVCVREDLTIPGKVEPDTRSSYGCVWHNFLEDPTITCWKIGPPFTDQNHEDSFLEPGLFLAWESPVWRDYTPPQVHPVMNVLKVPVKTLIDAPALTYFPTLKGHGQPKSEMIPNLTKEFLVPCTIVEDELYSDNFSWRLANSPFYRLERQCFFKLIQWAYNKTSVDQTPVWEYTYGITEDYSLMQFQKTGVEISGSAGVNILDIFDLSVTVTLNKECGYENTESHGIYEETTASIPITIPPGKTVAVWQYYNHYVLKRHDGTHLKDVTSWDFGEKGYVFDEYPD